MLQCISAVYNISVVAIQGDPKICHIFVRLITLSNFDQFSNFFHSKNQEKICNNTISLKTPPHLNMCRYTTLWNVECFKATTEKKTWRLL